MDLIEPKETQIKRQDGSVATFLIGKYPAIAGREIVTQYPVNNIPKLAEYQASEDVMLKLMQFVAIVPPGEDAQPIRLTTRALVDNHARDWETLARLEWQSLEYNCSFFANGSPSDIFQEWSQKAIRSIVQTLTDSLRPSSPAAKQR